MRLRGGVQRSLYHPWGISTFEREPPLEPRREEPAYRHLGFEREWTTHPRFEREQTTGPKRAQPRRRPLVNRNVEGKSLLNKDCLKV
jgi:hypothetical protein